MPTTVFYVTNRAPIGGATAPPYYSLDATPGAEAGLNAGRAEVTTAAAPEAPRQIVAVMPDPAPSGRAAAKAVAPAVAAWAEAAIAGQQDAALFIHGYANSWEDSIKRGAQLRDFYAQPEAGTARPLSVLAFGWPSDGMLVPPHIHYPDDRRDAAAAGPAMAALFAQLARVVDGIRAKGLKLHLIAHSMGNWALRHGLLSYGPPAGGDPLFDEALLAAADEDADALIDPGKLAALPRLAKRITVQVNDGDVVLLLAMGLTGKRRLGLAWPTELAAVAGRDDAAIRVSPAIVGQNELNLTSHQYYRNNLTVRRDVISVFEGRPQAEIRRRTPDAAGGPRFVLFGVPEGGPPMV